mmetsp:Transcript_123752/g.283736  ORF Transcript_123752/g.283736 Transcript_123752/m.283736 type:complete len:227 (+) Transcript_123752:1623-2303(+)
MVPSLTTPAACATSEIRSARHLYCARSAERTTGGTGAPLDPGQDATAEATAATSPSTMVTSTPLLRRASIRLATASRGGVRPSSARCLAPCATAHSAITRPTPRVPPVITTKPARAPCTATSPAPAGGRNGRSRAAAAPCTPTATSSSWSCSGALRSAAPTSHHARSLSSSMTTRRRGISGCSRRRTRAKPRTGKAAVPCTTTTTLRRGEAVLVMAWIAAIVRISN